MEDAGRLGVNIPHVLDVEHFAQVTCGPGWSKQVNTRTAVVALSCTRYHWGTTATAVLYTDVRRS